jgi:chitinase
VWEVISEWSEDFLFLLQILLAIGGWAFGSTPFKELTSNVYRMNQFVYEAIELLRDYKFNGLDVDWEYPR